MFARFRLRALLPLAAIAFATCLVGGCAYYPYDYYGYGYSYGYPSYPYYAPAPALSFNFGYWGHRDWDHPHWRNWDH
jgi:hypothetical protein